MPNLGRWIYSLGAIGLGVTLAAYGAFSPDWLSVSPHLPGYHVIAYACAAWLILAGLAVNAPRVGGTAALALASLFVAGILLREAPYTLAKPEDWGGWQGIAESMAMSMGGVLVCAQSRDVGLARPAMVARIARIFFGLCLAVFGVSHFVYAKLTASLVPTWLPPSQLAWADITGAAQIAAGLAMLSGVQARLAAMLLTVMYVIFTCLVHIPSVIASPTSQDNWTENAINLLLIGVAWTAADSLRTPSSRHPVRSRDVAETD
ncbi:MAG TPA: DoxX family protein [Caulobacteraceae bacterium]|jgi:uncharacterized membrane protein YphA (DoxX/SURF4 family)